MRKQIKNIEAMFSRQPHLISCLPITVGAVNRALLTKEQSNVGKALTLNQRILSLLYKI